MIHVRGPTHLLYCKSPCKRKKHKEIDEQLISTRGCTQNGDECDWVRGRFATSKISFCNLSRIRVCNLSSVLSTRVSLPESYLKQPVCIWRTEQFESVLLNGMMNWSMYATGIKRFRRNLFIKEKEEKINKPPFKCPNFNEPGKKSENTGMP